LPFEFSRPLILVAHPDDETIACGGLLQRMVASLVVFATDGAPPHYGFEKKFGTLAKYSNRRFQEAAAALSHVPTSSFQRLTKPDGSHFVDQHLFQDLSHAVASLCMIARAFSPDALVSHAYEGGHIDHDACSFIARHAAEALSLRRFEFPLYWVDDDGKAMVQRFRDIGATPLEWRLTEVESACKRKMLAEYKTQPELASGFPPATEWVRVATRTDFSIPLCRDYSYRNWRPRLWQPRISSKALLKKFAEFQIRQRVPYFLRAPMTGRTQSAVGCNARE
jgi:N-acetylglucosamine malate deacetylase 2